MSDTDPTPKELRTLDLALAELCGIETEQCVGDRWLFEDPDEPGELFLHVEEGYNNGQCEGVLWQPSRSFDQAWKYLGPLIAEDRRDLTILAGNGNAWPDAWAEVHEGREQIIHEEASSIALAFCLAARAALEDDDAKNA